MSIRAVARRWNAIAAALAFEPEIILPRVCGLEAFGEEEPLIVSFEGCRRDLVADIVFGSEKWPEVGYTSFVPINLEPGPALNAVIATRTDLLVSLSGATNRIRHVRGIEAGGHLAVHGVSAEKIGFKQSRLCFVRIASRAKASSAPNVHAFELTYDRPRGSAARGEPAALPSPDRPISATRTFWRGRYRARDDRDRWSIRELLERGNGA
jgi:hypothetical protein